MVLALAKWTSVFQDVSVDFDVAPALERREHHEEVGGAVALVLIMATDRTSRFHRDRHPRFREQLL